MTNDVSSGNAIPTREEAWALLCEWTHSESLRKHALAVEAAMRAYARSFGEDEVLWGAVALLHDFDYERFPDPKDHPFRGAEVLRDRGISETIVRAILSHADYSGVPRESLLERCLFACDELCGFITAVALVRPDRRVASVEVRSVRKRMKEKSFARGVSREDLVRGAEEIGRPLDEHIAFVIGAMGEVADELGL